MSVVSRLAARVVSRMHLVGEFPVHRLVGWLPVLAGASRAGAHGPQFLGFGRIWLACVLICLDRRSKGRIRCEGYCRA